VIDGCSLKYDIIQNGYENWYFPALGLLGRSRGVQERISMLEACPSRTRKALSRLAFGSLIVPGDLSAKGAWCELDISTVRS
jgi:hypothetical protein